MARELDSYLEKSIFFAQFDALFPTIVAFVQVSGDSSELGQLVFFEFLGQGDCVEIVERVDRRTQSLKMKMSHYIFGKRRKNNGSKRVAS